MQNLLSELSTRKLRPTSIAHDASAPKVTGCMSEESATQYQSTCLDANVEEWLDLLGDLTFATAYCPLTVEDGRMLVSAFELFNKAHQAQQETFEFPEDMLAHARQIADRLQPVIAAIRESFSYHTSPAPVFIKLSSRSFKDAPVTQTAIRTKFLDLVAKSPDSSENTKLICMLQAGLDGLKVYDAYDAVMLMMRSERVCQDMLLALDHLHRWRENIVVRQWVDIDVGMEFRCFVFDSKLTAISQYNHLCHFPFLVDNADAIKSKLLEFFESSVRQKLDGHFKNYIIDFAVTDDRVWIIELNPFLETTDGALFSWQTERGLLEGQNPQVEFRVRTAPAFGAKAMIANDWRQLLEIKS
eukprot:c2196_g1_i1.p1 GENE.c2196_g1_i1~~c2196_g1_i1.p1  ORF type:complete len:357 (-),score=78.07 c2196_g1_i1:3-1073(-)